MEVELPREALFTPEITKTKNVLTIKIPAQKKSNDNKGGHVLRIQLLRDRKDWGFIKEVELRIRDGENIDLKAVARLLGVNACSIRQLTHSLLEYT